MRRGGRPRRLHPDSNLEVILLGTGTPLPNKARACASTLVLAGEKSFLVDTGRGFLNNFASTGLADVDAVFFTHYHSDHFGEFGEFMVTRTLWGANKPLLVIGPPGAKSTITNLLAAYSLDSSYRKAHHGSKWHERGMAADIQARDPGVVYDDGGVTVSMFAVASRLGIYLIACMSTMEPDKPPAYRNAAVLYDPGGKIVGLYFKTHSTSGNLESTFYRAGDSFPVFDVKLGGMVVRIGIMIC
ncbi:MAG: nitrilase-related carbon-nitrogen hydrolase, partial [Candidatus Sigynarchaeota archaeon]